jgi:hypothetical protein
MIGVDQYCSMGPCARVTYAADLGHQVRFRGNNSSYDGERKRAADVTKRNGSEAPGQATEGKGDNSVLWKGSH